MSGRPDPARIATWRLFLQTHTRIVERLEAELDAAHRLPLTWYDVLAQLQETPERCLRIQELGHALALTGSGLSRRVTRMEEADLVERHPCPDDRRGVLVALTRRGEEALRAAAPVHLQGVQRYFAAYLTDDEDAAMGTAFARMLAGLADEAAIIPNDVTIR